MKLRWLVLGAVVVAGGVFALKHFTDSKKNPIDSVIDAEGQSYSEALLHNTTDTEYQEIDFSA